MNFVDRERELAELEAVDRRPGGQFLAVFGRRRIGKTALLVHWLRKRSRADGVYWVAYRSSGRLLLARFSQAIQALSGNTDPDFCYSSWEAAFRDLARLAEKRRCVVVIDEWPYLAESVPGIATVLQAAWDHHLKSSKIVLVLAGSHFRMMHDELLSPSGALYGRTTANLMLGEIPSGELGQFLPRYSADQLVETFSIVGGVPKYLELWRDSWPVLRNVQETVLSSATIFRQEPSFLVQDEIGDARTYLGILEALGRGMRTPTTLSRLTGIALPHMGKYLNTLLLLKLVRRDISIDAPDPGNSRMARYEIADPYLRFHFTFVRPQNDLLEQGRIKAVMKMITERFDSYVGHTGYEELCRRRIIEMGDADELSFVPERVGRLFNRKIEVDLAAINTKERCLLLGECKWSRHKVGWSVVEELEAKAAALSRSDGFKRHLAVFARSGFEPQVLRRAPAASLLLFEGAFPVLRSR